MKKRDSAVQWWSNLLSRPPDAYVGAVFDGRFVYFVPNHNGTAQHDEVLRYDTTCPCDGDVIDDGIVELLDLLAVLDCLCGGPANPACDVNCDGQNDFDNFGIVLCQFSVAISPSLLSERYGHEREVS